MEERRRQGAGSSTSRSLGGLGEDVPDSDVPEVHYARRIRTGAADDSMFMEGAP